jgi:hypothetical protein
MNKNTSITMAAALAVAGILTLAILTMTLQHQAFAGNYNPCCEKQPPCCDNDNKQPSKEVAIGGNGGSGGAGGAGGEGGQGGENVSKEIKKAHVDQDANGGDSDGGHGGNANGGNARA